MSAARAESGRRAPSRCNATRPRARAKRDGRPHAARSRACFLLAYSVGKLAVSLRPTS
ncbi:uncharacterized protein BCN122_I2430 [Burkholderia cenocepacia]|nr:uncharacterized protein BCN122_I2430 [Burkholderia cenocepacia]